jgi:FkbM family methyltransferase
MNRQTLERRAEAVVGDRAVRFVEFCGVGATGTVVDLVVTTTALATTHYLLANTLGFLVAVSWNFAGNWWFTFERPDGAIPRQYASYVGLHAVTFGLRAVVLTVLIEAAGMPVLAATLVGVGVAAIANYLGTERILQDGIKWFDAVAALNSLAHAVYGSRLRGVLRSVGLYGLCYRVYGRVLALLYRDDTLAVTVGDATATLRTEQPAETVSILHTLEKEQPILEAFVEELEPDDVVWDVGANLGVYASLAADAGAEVVAIEPVPLTADRLGENLEGNGGGEVIEGALAGHTEPAALLMDRDDLGTQTPTLCAAGRPAKTRSVSAITGDRLVESGGVPAPDVLKIDIEGAELSALAGLEGTLAEHVDVAFVETHGESAPVHEALAEAGFDVEHADHAESGETYLIGRRS